MRQAVDTKRTIMTEIKVPKRMMEQDDKEVHMQEDLLMYQLLQRQLRQLGSEAEVVERRAFEAAATKQSIQELGNTGDILMPIGSGCYVHSKFSDSKHVLVDIGAGVLLSKTPEEATASVAERERETAKLKADIQNEADKIIEQMNSIATRVKK